jgi:hypothetical protein
LFLELAHVLLDFGGQRVEVGRFEGEDVFDHGLRIALRLFGTRKGGLFWLALLGTKAHRLPIVTILLSEIKQLLVSKSTIYFLNSVFKVANREEEEEIYTF